MSIYQKKNDALLPSTTHIDQNSTGPFILVKPFCMPTPCPVFTCSVCCGEIVEQTALLYMGFWHGKEVYSHRHGN